MKNRMTFRIVTVVAISVLAASLISNRYWRIDW
jgi:hypothetical protein